MFNQVFFLGGFRVASGNSLVFIDPSSLRRSTNTSSASSSNHDGVTMTTTAACLARSFAIVLRQIADLLGSLHNVSAPQQQPVPITYQDCIHLQVKLLVLELFDPQTSFLQ